MEEKVEVEVEELEEVEVEEVEEVEVVEEVMVGEVVGGGGTSFDPSASIRSKTSSKACTCAWMFTPVSEFFSAAGIGRSSQFRRRSSRGPWKRPASSSNCEEAYSIRNRLPVTAPAAPRK